MARPLKEGMDYFPHDTTASADKKIEALTYEKLQHSVGVTNYERMIRYGK